MQNIMDFYEDLDFEEAEIEDELTAFFFEISPGGNYVLVTDEDGNMPKNLKEPVIFACYTSEGSFLWSAGFKNSYVFKEIWSAAQTPEQKLTAVQNYKEVHP
ncbi:MAG: hypothetical protein H6Q65_620 [Firmicutes bacterium]|nr:hypothetical protein [Bacillota bacterium]